MAVPTSNVSTLGIAKELKYNNYNSTCDTNPPFAGWRSITCQYTDINGTQNITVYFNDNISDGETWVNGIGNAGYENISTTSNPTPLNNQRGTYTYDYTTCANTFQVDSNGRIFTTTPIC